MQRPAFQTTTSVADRRLDVRYIGPIAGCYTFSNAGVQPQSVEVYACRTQSLSAAAIAITAPVTGAVGMALSARIDGIGLIRGTVERRTSDGFVFRITATPEERLKLAAKIAWLKQNKVHHEDDRREHKRFEPRDPRSIMTLADGIRLPCFLMDLSRSGAAVSSQNRPALGTPVVIGSLNGRVIRYLDVGYAVQFDAVQEREGLEELTKGAQAPAEAPATPTEASAASTAGA